MTDVSAGSLSEIQPESQPAATNNNVNNDGNNDGNNHGNNDENNGENEIDATSLVAASEQLEIVEPDHFSASIGVSEPSDVDGFAMTEAEEFAPGPHTDLLDNLRPAPSQSEAHGHYDENEAMWGYASEPEHHDVHQALQAAEETRLLRAAHDQGIPRLNEAEALNDSRSPFLQPALVDALASLHPQSGTATVELDELPPPLATKAKSKKRFAFAAGFATLAISLGTVGWFAASPKNSIDESPLITVDVTADSTVAVDNGTDSVTASDPVAVTTLLQFEQAPDADSTFINAPASTLPVTPAATSQEDVFGEPVGSDLGAQATDTLVDPALATDAFVESSTPVAPAPTTAADAVQFVTDGLTPA
jgi:hypothetical protein